MRWIRVALIGLGPTALGLTACGDDDVGGTGATTTGNPGTGGPATEATASAEESGSACAAACASGFCDEQQRCARIVFVTNAAWTGDLGGFAGADAKCRAQAEAAGLPGDYAAWLGHRETLAPDRVRLLEGDLPFARTDGKVIAEDAEPFVTEGSSLLLPVSLDAEAEFAPSVEMGACPAITQGTAVWTGMLPDGTVDGENNCNAWTDGTDAFTGRGVGKFDEADADWTHACTGSPCDLRAALYCFQLPP